MDALRSLITPIFRPTPSGSAELIGSGVLLLVRDIEILVTAAHVISHREHTSLLIPARGANRFLLLEGPWTMSSNSFEASFDETAVDLGYFAISDSLRNKMADEGYGFLVACPDAVTYNVDSFSEETCAFEGFPSILNLPTESPRAMLSTRVYGRFYSDRTLYRFGYDSRRFLGIRYPDPQRPRDNQHEAFDLRCMSGGPIWSIADGRMRLAGIISQYYGSKSILLGTRIDFLLRFLNHIGIRN